MHRVVHVVVPLRVGQPWRAGRVPAEARCIVEVVLQHQMHMPLTPGASAHGTDEFVEEAPAAEAAEG